MFSDIFARFHVKCPFEAKLQFYCVYLHEFQLDTLVIKVFLGGKGAGGANAVDVFALKKVHLYLYSGFITSSIIMSKACYHDILQICAMTLSGG